MRFDIIKLMDENQPQPAPQKTPLRRPIMRYEQPEEKKKERIPLWIAGALITLAFCLDLTEMVLEWLAIGVFGFSTLLSICGTVIFWIWFKMLDVDFGASPKKFITMASSSTLGSIPGLHSIGGFAWTVGTIVIITMTRAEDKGGTLGKMASVASSTMGKKKI